MDDDATLVDSMARAVAAAPDDLALRLHLARLLVDARRPAEALQHLSLVLAADPAQTRALALLTEATAALSQPSQPSQPELEQPRTPRGTAGPAGFDWSAAEAEVGDLAPPVFVDGPAEPVDPETERPTVRLSDVGGMQQVKDRLEAAFLAPMRNPELRKLYGKSLRGGLLLYGPPGCGKTFLARAVAGEMGAAFYSVSLADVLDIWIGASEKNVASIFETVRRNAPCVLFLDEVDAIAQKRSQVRGSGMRGTVNQLLTELDDVLDRNEGVFVLAATNAPWDIDAALRRPGRLDRTLLVLPPDAPAREAILRYHLQHRPLAGIDLGRLVKATDGFSGADLAHLCDSAAELALLDSARSGTARMIEQRDAEAALREIRPSTRPWLEAARNVVQYANESGQYDDLLVYLKAKKLL